MTHIWAVRVSAAACSTLAATAFLTAVGPGTATADSACPVVFALGVQGTGQSSPNASPTDDTGFLSSIFTPLLGKTQAAGVSVNREYVPYDASFGGYAGTGGSGNSYGQSVTGGVERLSQRISEIAQQCPATEIALAGYSQGAHVVSMLAQEIGGGSGPIPADKVAAVALFGDPTRATGAGTFPGTIDQRPAAVPGTSGESVSGLDTVAATTAAGAGIGGSTGAADTSAKAANFGALVGRVASFCTSGDLACDAPSDNAALLKTVAQVASQVDHGGDPIAALTSIGNALAMTSIKTATSVVNDDISGDSLANLQITPKKSISARLAEASDPNGSAIDPAQVMKALIKVATIGLNAVVTVAKNVLTPTNIAEIAAAGLADPIAGLATFGAKLGAAVVQLVPPATGIRLIQQTFTAVASNLIDNADLLKATTWVKYSDTITKHGAYLTDAVTQTGTTATAWVSDWITAAAKDLAGAPAHAAGSTPSPTASSSAPTTSSSPAN